MRLIRQFTILVIVCFIGVVLHALIPLPVPASIYGLVLMFCALHFKLIPLDAVTPTTDHILAIMPMLFIPSTVGLILAWDILKVRWLQLLLIGIGSTTAVFFASGHVTQLVIRLTKKGKTTEKEESDD